MHKEKVKSNKFYNITCPLCGIEVPRLLEVK
jgi:hypothetical protein